MILGLALSAWLMPGPRAIGATTFDYHTLLFAAMAILIGFQSVNFAIFAMIFAIREHLLPESPELTRLFRYITLEVGLIAGTILTVVGACIWVLGLSYWRSRHFGPLDSEHTMRLVIPGLVSLTLGVQIILTSFFLSILGLRRG
jgi:hypothetical protein